MNDLISLILIGTAVMVVFAVAFIALLVASNKRIIESQQTRLLEIQKSEKRYKALFENSLAGMMKFDAKTWEIVDANQSMFTIFHCSSLFQLQKIFRSIAPDQMNKLQTALLQKGVVGELELTFFNSADKEQCILFSGRRDSADGMVHGVVIDITEKKKMEKVYIRAQKMEVISLLTSSLAHDLQNILAPISLSINLLNKNNASSKTKDILRAAKESTNEGINLAKNILAIGRGSKPEFKKVNMYRLLDYTIKGFRTQKKVTIHFSKSTSKSDAVILGDENQLKQVFLNLIQNAKDALSGRGKIKIKIDNTITVEEIRDAGIIGGKRSFLKIAISDNGMGIPKENLGKIFEPFFTTKEVGVGTGLGLSIVAEIVKNHNGYISVKSESNKGTTFTLFLPTNNLTHE